MGKVWPQGSIAFHESTTALSNIVSIDESPRWADLLIVGTDDGLVQITEDGGRTWRKVEDFPGDPKFAYVSDVQASPIDANVMFVTLNNWQRGDYKPYVVKSVDRGKTWTNISGDLPALHDVWAIAQDFVAPDLLFAGTEFGLFFTVDGGKKWVQLKGGMPATQVRDLQLQKRESDVVMATFGRGFWILDDYSALREVSAQAMAEEARLFPTRAQAYQFVPWGLAQDGSAGLATLGGNYAFPNPPAGAAITYHVRQNMGDDTQLVANIYNAQNTQVRRLTLNKNAGLYRAYWNFQFDPGVPGRAAEPEYSVPPDEVQAGQGAGAQGQGAQGQGAQGQGAGAGRAGAPAGAPPQGGRGGRGGGGATAEPGRYRIVLGKLVGETFTPIGQPQFVQVVDLPERNYMLWR